MKSSIFFIFCIVLSITQIFALKANSRCLLGKDGKEICKPAVFQAIVPVRMQLSCSQTDMDCWNMKAIEYTNDVRRRNGQSKPLRAGPVIQLENALRHSRQMSSRRSLDHQKLRDVTRQIGCKLFAAAENIAYTSDSNGDIAKTCVDMWEGSPGHLRNILLDFPENCVVGMYIDNRGLLWCTQTFTKQSQFETFGNPNDPGCKTAGKLSEIKKPMTTDSRSEGNRSCRCLEVGNGCWSSLREKSGNRCLPFTSPSRQPSACRKACCDYCAEYQSAPPCKSRNVRNICRIPEFGF